MKGLILLSLLGVFAAVSARSTSLQRVPVSTLAERGENPWVVHLRLAVATSGFLETCGGSIISPRWALTTATCVLPSRFIWIRFGAVRVPNPELVIETSAFSLNPTFDQTSLANNVALVNINRNVQFTPNIRPAAIEASDAEVADSGRFCGFGAVNDGPGEELSCFDVTLEEESGILVATGETGEFSRFDLGGALVDSDNVQIGVYNSVDGTFLRTGQYREWLELVTGSDLNGSS